MRKIFGFIGQFFGDQWRQFAPTGQLLFVLGIAAIVVDAGIAYEYGISMSGLHAAGFALVAIGLALLPDLSAREYDRGAHMSCAIIAVACVPLAGVAYQSHIGYGASIRLGDMQQTGFQHTTLDGAKAALGDERASLKTFREQREILMAEREAVKASSPWVTSTTAQAVREEVKVLDGRIADEIDGKRGRAKGCKAVCEKLQDERKDALAKIAGIEKLEGVTARLAELDKSIAATQRVIDDKTAKVATTGYKSSTVVNQNTALGDLWHLVTGNEAKASNVSLATMGNSSLAFLILAPLFMFAAGRNRKPEYMNRRHDHGIAENSHNQPPVSELGNRNSEPRAYPSSSPLATTLAFKAPQQNTHTREIVRTDASVWADLSRALKAA